MKLIDIAGFPVVEFEEVSFYNAVNAPKKANIEAVGGFSDWVLPDPHTLKALASLQPESLCTCWLWASSPDTNDSRVAWCVGFDYGDTETEAKDRDYRVRLVRAGQLLEIGRAGQLESIRQADIPLPA